MDDSSINNNNHSTPRASIMDADTRMKYGLRNSIAPGTPTRPGAMMDDSSVNNNNHSTPRASIMDADTRMKYGLRNSMAPGTPTRAGAASGYSTPDRSMASSFDETSVMEEEEDARNRNGDEIIAIKAGLRNSTPPSRNSLKTHTPQADVNANCNPNASAGMGAIDDDTSTSLRPGAYRGSVPLGSDRFDLERAQSLEKGRFAILGLPTPDDLQEGMHKTAECMVVPQLAPQQASRMNANAAANKAIPLDASRAVSRKKLFWLKHFWWIFVLLILVVIGVVVGVVVSASKSSSDSDTSETVTESPHPSTEPTLAVPVAVLFPTTILPNSTVAAIDSQSRQASQYVAYEWLVADPHFVNYSEPQRLQRFALATFFHATDGPNWLAHADPELQEWNNWLDYDVHECDWFSLGLSQGHDVCAGYDSSVAGLFDHYDYSSMVLSGDPTASPNGPQLRFYKQVRGSLVPELSLLTSLQRLDVGLQTLRGSIPSELEQLSSHLKTIILYDNELTGVIPPSIYGFAETLWLSHNTDFDRQDIPTTIGTSTALRSFFCINCNLVGSIPSELYQLTNLQTLLLGENEFEGTLATQIRQLTGLQQLVLSQNRFSGSLPTELGLLTMMQRLEIESDSLSGSIPSEFGSMTALTTLSLAGNQLSGTLVTELGNLFQLRQLKLSMRTQIQQLSNRDLSGVIPREYFVRRADDGANGTLSPAFPWLEHLWLENTRISGEIPTELGLMTNLMEIRMGRNPNMEGSIPSELGLLTALTSIALAKIGLESTIPTELGRLTRLHDLYLQDNNLTGTGTGANSTGGGLPDELEALAGSLQWFRVDGNADLDGTVPPGLCVIPTLVLGCEADTIPNTGETSLCGCLCQCL